MAPGVELWKTDDREGRVREAGGAAEGRKINANMSREIKRVPLDFNAPRGKVWEGYINPQYKGHCKNCAECDGSGYGPEARLVQAKWYGNAPFRPSENDSESFTIDMPEVWQKAERNVNHAPEYYGRDEGAVYREANRLCVLFNGAMRHHVNQADVDALLRADRLWDFTRTARTPEQAKLIKQRLATGKHNSWLPESNGYRPTAREVNLWSLQGMGHDSINCSIVVRDRVGEAKLNCAKCSGNGQVWDSPANEKAYDDWKKTEPPKGDGWQLWETVSEGSPISPVFATADELASHLVNFGDDWGAMRGERYSQAAAEAIVKSGWCMSAISMGGKFYSGADALVALSNTK